MLRRALLSLALLLSSASLLEAQPAPTTIFIVRHAEKGPENPDPSLTPAGRARAEELARVLVDARVTAIFASEFKRTQETVAPLSRATGVATLVVPAAGMDTLIGRLRALPPGSRAVVASHSNLVPAIAQRLSGVTLAPLTDADYDRLVVVTIGGDGRAEVVVLRYGAP